MATVKYNVCDRCGKEINYHSRLLAKIKYNKWSIKWTLFGSVSEHEKELCGDCSSALEDFLFNKVSE